MKAAVPARARVQQQHVADAAARGLAIALRNGGGEVTMRLRPEALGAMKVQLRVEDARVWARLVPGSASARDLLTESLAHLRSALEAQGLTVERLDVAALPGGERAGGSAGGGPDRASQDAVPQKNGAESPSTQVTPDGPGTSPNDSSGPRSGAGEREPGGDRAGTRTEALNDIAPESPWGFALGATTVGVMEWIA